MAGGAAAVSPARRALLAAAAAGLLAPGLTLRAAGVLRAQPHRIDVMRFSAMRAGGALPAAIKPYSFGDRPRHTRYSLVEDEGAVVLRAQAEASTSGLVRELRIDPRTHPLLRWRWKATNLVAAGDIASKAGDDFAARVYVAFDLDPDTLPVGERLKLGLARMIYGDGVPLAVLCYVWDARAPADAIAPNAYTDRVRMVVAESGRTNIGRWVSVERNVYRDYQRAFGGDAAKPPPVPAISAVIVSTDTDNTGESIEAFYGDIWFAAA